MCELTCRICFMPEITWEDELIAPCLCKGTNKWVHESCLNEWRKTSREHNTTCSTCKGKYEFASIYIFAILYEIMAIFLQSIMYSARLLLDIYAAVVSLHVVVSVAVLVCYWNFHVEIVTDTLRDFLWFTRVAPLPTGIGLLALRFVYVVINVKQVPHRLYKVYILGDYEEIETVIHPLISHS